MHRVPHLTSKKVRSILMSSYDGTERPRLPNKKEKTMTGSQVHLSAGAMKKCWAAQTPIALICLDANILPSSLPAKKGV